jgi:hypothetical protein
MPLEREREKERERERERKEKKREREREKEREKERERESERARERESEREREREREGEKAARLVAVWHACGTTACCAPVLLFTSKGKNGARKLEKNAAVTDFFDKWRPRMYLGVCAFGLRL